MQGEGQTSGIRAGGNVLIGILWIPLVALGALVTAPAHLTLVSTYNAHWYAVAIALVAAWGRRHKNGVIASAALSGAGGLGLAVWESYRLVLGANWSDWAFVVGGLIVFGLSVTQIVRSARGRSWDPLVVAAGQLYLGVVALWIYYWINGAALDYHNYQPTTLVSFLRSSLPFAALALAAVGLGINRNAPAALERLGLVVPAWWQVVLALLMSQLFLLAEPWINVLTFHLTPEQYRQIALVSYSTYASEPWWIYLAFAVIAGVSEEMLFRGAVQPRLGIFATALVFALGHVQYGVTPILAGVFVHGLIYGLLRRYANTTTSIVAHAGYDFGAYMAFGPAAYIAGASVLTATLVIPALRNRQAVWRTLTTEARKRAEV